MAIDLGTLSVGQLESLIANHREKHATDTPLYVDALRELEKRKGKGLDFDKSLSIIRQAAQEGRVLSYKELADTSSTDWGQVYRVINRHLLSLVEYADRQGWPLLSAIVVNKPNVASGKLEPDALRGFIAAARRLDYPITDEQAFLKEQQARVFAWAQGEPRSNL